jgi:hypothetical protein
VEVDEVDTEVEADADVEDGAAVDVTVTVDVLWTVVSDMLPTLVPLPVSPLAAPKGDNRTGVPRIEEGAPALKAWVATTTEPTPARRTRTSTEMTDSF